MCAPCATSPTEAEYQDQHWFGIRPSEELELYDPATDLHQINNLATDPEFADELTRHRKILESWITRIDDQGQYPESLVQHKATYNLWKDKSIFSQAKVNPEYEQFRAIAVPNQ